MLPSTLDMVPSPSTWNPRPSTLDKKIDSPKNSISERSDDRKCVCCSQATFLAGGLICIRRGDLMNDSISIKFNLFKFTAHPVEKGPHFCLTLDKIPGQNHSPLDRTVIRQSR